MADFILNMPLRFFARVFGNPAGDPVLLKSRGVTLLRDIPGEAKFSNLLSFLLASATALRRGRFSADYVGYTARHLHQRIAEHKNSAIGRHFLEAHGNNNLLRESQFTVLRKCQSKFDCLVFEMLFIKKLKPNLNIHTCETLCLIFSHIAYSEVRMADPSFYLDCGSYQGEPLDTATNNGNWTECSPIRSVIIRVINKIGRPRSGRQVVVVMVIVINSVIWWLYLSGLCMIGCFNCPITGFRLQPTVRLQLYRVISET
ncbi:hypothetical protein pdam_00006333 [Pocillopora damicornis]|uniref:GIY-YIG domain-containing protein n=1 Tax=Pocillopora damicornis TaxID=46731 RepID=A0A3M6TQI2_POCDA|nr:hypothetical protein pdam_00006333 [Pocillopora damicornis]